ncbi:MAG: hypothetical protein RIR70_1787 [Pseudomonadota bacterium]|jgi:hypothetical protein
MRAVFSFIALLWFGLASANPPEVLRDVAPQWAQIGSAKFRWFGLHIYDIALWSAGRGFDDKEPKEPYALAIRYARNIPGDQLVNTSLEQMRGLGYRDEAELARWRGLLVSVFPDVKPGEVIVGVHQPGVGAKFFHEGKPTGAFNDVKLAKAFFGIWMDEKTSEPGLRAKLLGRP